MWSRHKIIERDELCVLCFKTRSVLARNVLAQVIVRRERNEYRSKHAPKFRGILINEVKLLKRYVN